MCPEWRIKSALLSAPLAVVAHILLFVLIAELADSDGGHSQFATCVFNKCNENCSNSLEH